MNARDEDDRTPLHHAADSKVDVVRFLLQHKAAPNVIDRFGYTPLVWTILECQPRSEEIARLLRDYGAEYDLTAAAANGDLKRVRAILDENPSAITQVPSAANLLGLPWALADKDTLPDRIEIINLLFASGLEVDASILRKQADDCGFEDISQLLRAKASQQSR